MGIYLRSQKYIKNIAVLKMYDEISVHNRYNGRRSWGSIFRVTVTNEGSEKTQHYINEL